MFAAAWKLIKESAVEFLEDDAMPRAASLAFYTALGLAPMILLFLSITSYLGEGTKEAMIGQIESMVGAQGGDGGESAQAIEQVVESAEQRDQGSTIWATAISIVTLLFSASGIFAQLQEALNKMWDVAPKKGAGVWGWISKRLLSMGMVLAMLFLLLVSLVVTAALTMINPGGGEGPLWALLSTGVSLLVYWAGFAIILKYLPDAKITWRDVAIGAAITAILFAVGKYAIGLYIGNKSFGSEYGAAGSLIALLIWVYYSGIIFFFGAEVTQVFARHFGAGVVPEDNAERKNEKMPALKYD